MLHTRPRQFYFFHGITLRPYTVCSLVKIVFLDVPISGHPLSFKNVKIAASTNIRVKVVLPISM